MRTRLIALCLILISASSAAAGNKITFYRDGALFQQESGAVKGLIDIPLAAGLLAHTLTVIPASGTRILAVETYSGGTERASGRDVEALTEQKRRLEDRLLALDTREAIFTSAAKAQSGKAPRKTKTNPEPLQAIRQGTDFAIAQLEAVYTARRRATQEMQKIDARLAECRKNGKQADGSVRITVTPARGRVTLRYATAERGWRPQYNLFIEANNSALLQLSARTNGSTNGMLRVSSGSLAESATAETFPAQSGSTVLANYRIPVKEELSSEGIFNRFSGTITNSSTQYLQAGESGLFRNGIYLGRFRFEGLSSGRSRVISLGN